MDKPQMGEVVVSVNGEELHRGRDASVSPLPLNADGFQIAIDVALAGDPRSAWDWARRVLLGERSTKLRELAQSWRRQALEERTYGWNDSAGALEDCAQALEKLMGDGT